MTVIYPEATPSQGNTTVIVADAIANMAAPSIGTDLAAAVNISCFLHGFNPTASTNKGSAPTRICDTNQLEQLGRTTYSIDALAYVYDPQADDTDDANKAKAALPEGAEKYIVERLGLAARTTATAATQKVRVHHVRLGPQIPGVTGDDEFAEYQMTQEVVYIEPPVDGVLAA